MPKNNFKNQFKKINFTCLGTWFSSTWQTVRGWFSQTFSGNFYRGKVCLLTIITHQITTQTKEDIIIFLCLWKTNPTWISIGKESFCFRHILLPPPPPSANRAFLAISLFSNSTTGKRVVLITYFFLFQKTVQHFRSKAYPLRRNCIQFLWAFYLKDFDRFRRAEFFGYRLAFHLIKRSRR